MTHAFFLVLMLAPRLVFAQGDLSFNVISPIWPTTIEELPQLDAVIISHNHYDHLNEYSIKRLKDKAYNFIVPCGVGKLIQKWGVDQKKIIELEWWEEFSYLNLTVTATPAQHFSGRGLFDRNATLWASWVIAGPNHKIFFSGDTGYFDGFKTIGDKFGPFDMTFLECGAYNQAWSDVHMMPEETVQAHLDLQGKILQPIHWGTFNLSLHPWYEPMERVSLAGRQHNITLSTPQPGAIVTFEAPANNNKWWQNIAKL